MERNISRGGGKVPVVVTAAGLSFTLMTFLTSILLGLCMGSGALFSIRFGQRDEAGLRGAVGASMLFCVAVSALVWVFARPLIALSVEGGETGIILEGVRYLRIEGAFYCGIGCLFLLYGLYRALGKPGMSVVLTVISLGTRVALAYALSVVPSIGVTGIWWSVPIGWALADMVGILYYIFRKKQLLSWENQAQI